MHSALPRVTARKPSRATSVASSHAKFGTWLEILFVPETSENSVRVNPGHNAVTPTPGWPTDPMNVDILKGLVIYEDTSDPIFVIREKYGVEIFSDYETKLVSARMNLVF